MAKMHRTTLALVLSSGVFAAALDLDSPALPLASRWVAWKSRFARHSADEAGSFLKFAATDREIKSHNRKGLPWTLGHNQFSDLTPDEFQARYLLPPHDLDLHAPPKTAAVNASDLPAPPASVDWVAKGAFPAVKNQGRCGSCWAFATVGTIESAFVIAGNELTTLSEQDLVSCSRPNGCDGGTAGSAYKWIQIHNRGPGASPGRGIPTAQTYPYTSGGNGTAGPCLTGRRDTPVVTLTGYTYVAKADEDALVAAAALTPVAVMIESDKSVFKQYKSGILDSRACGTNLDHVVVVAGYGTDGGVDYYNVRNSWGAHWGEAGYVRMVRGKNQCGISLRASFPTGVKATEPGPGPPAPPPPPPPAAEYACEHAAAGASCRASSTGTMTLAQCNRECQSPGTGGYTCEHAVTGASCKASPTSNKTLAQCNRACR